MQNILISLSLTEIRTGEKKAISLSQRKLAKGDKRQKMLRKTDRLLRYDDEIITASSPNMLNFLKSSV